MAPHSLSWPLSLALIAQALNPSSHARTRYCSITPIGGRIHAESMANRSPEPHLPTSLSLSLALITHASNPLGHAWPRAHSIAPIGSRIHAESIAIRSPERLRLVSPATHKKFEPLYFALHAYFARGRSQRSPGAPQFFKLSLLL